MAQLRGRDQDEIAKLIAQKSVTLLRTAPDLFPLRHDQKIAVLTAEGSLGKAIWRRAPDANVLVVPAYPSEERRTQLRERARELIRRAKVVVVGVINSRQLDLVALAAASGKPVVVVSMGLPYLTGQVEDAKAVLAVYSYRPVSAEAAAAALFGERGTPASSPSTSAGSSSATASTRSETRRSAPRSRRRRRCSSSARARLRPARSEAPSTVSRRRAPRESDLRSAAQPPGESCRGRRRSRIATTAPGRVRHPRTAFSLPPIDRVAALQALGSVARGAVDAHPRGERTRPSRCGLAWVAPAHRARCTATGPGPCTLHPGKRPSLRDHRRSRWHGARSSGGPTMLTHLPQNLPPEQLGSRERPPPDRWLHVRLIILGLLVILLLTWLVTRGDFRRSIEALPPEERAALYQRNLEAFRHDCVAKGPLVPQRCAQDARFLSKFPECDTACRAAIAPFLNRPSR